MLKNHNLVTELGPGKKDLGGFVSTPMVASAKDMQKHVSSMNKRGYKILNIALDPSTLKMVMFWEKAK